MAPSDHTLRPRSSARRGLARTIVSRRPLYMDVRSFLWAVRASLVHSVTSSLPLVL